MEAESTGIKHCFFWGWALNFVGLVGIIIRAGQPCKEFGQFQIPEALLVFKAVHIVPFKFFSQFL